MENIRLSQLWFVQFGLEVTLPHKETMQFHKRVMIFLKKWEKLLKMSLLPSREKNVAGYERNLSLEGSHLLQKM